MPVPLTIKIGVDSAAAIGAFSALGNLAAQLGMRLTAMVAQLPHQFAQGVRSAIVFGDELQKLGLRTGISTNKLAGLRLALKTADASIQDLIPAMRGWAQFGRGDFLEALLKTAAQFEKIPNATERGRIALQRFGRAALNLMPLLAMGRSNLETFLQAGERIFNLREGFANASVTLKDTWELIHARVQGIWITLADRLLPILQKFADRLMDMLMSPQFDQALMRLASSIERFAVAVGRLIDSGLDKWVEKLANIIDLISFGLLTLKQTPQAIASGAVAGVATGTISGTLSNILFSWLGMAEREFQNIQWKQIIDRITPSDPKTSLNWRRLLAQSNIEPGLGVPAHGADRFKLATSGRGTGFLQRGFLTGFEARALSTQVSLEREQTDLLRLIANTLSRLVPEVEKAF